MEIIFKSILKDEFESFIKFIRLSVTDCRVYYNTLMSLDSFMYDKCFNEKKLEADFVSCWLEGLKNPLAAKKRKLSCLKRFAEYLSTLGIHANIPELPRNIDEFMPYVFSMDEITQIFEAADDFAYSNSTSKKAAEFPMVLRILYGCGLRAGEVVALTWDDIDLEEGVITLKVTKYQKQRLVPMGNELKRILTLYSKTPCFKNHTTNLLFSGKTGQHRHKSSYWHIFNVILCELGIKNEKTIKYGSRGPCIHSLRHTFTMHSLLKAESEGRGFMETVPFLSTYLGHERLMETDKYLKARHELYTESHRIISDYIRDVLPQEV